jgi:hypothetical protein
MRPITYPERVMFRVTPSLRAAVEREAAKAQCGVADYYRRLIVAALQAQGVTIAEAAEA